MVVRLQGYPRIRLLIAKSDGYWAEDLEEHVAYGVPPPWHWIVVGAALTHDCDFGKPGGEFCEGASTLRKLAILQIKKRSRNIFLRAWRAWRISTDRILTSLAPIESSHFQRSNDAKFVEFEAILTRMLGAFWFCCIFNDFRDKI